MQLMKEHARERISRGKYLSKPGKQLRLMMCQQQPILPKLSGLTIRGLAKLVWIKLDLNVCQLGRMQLSGIYKSLVRL